MYKSLSVFSCFSSIQNFRTISELLMNFICLVLAHYHLALYGYCFLLQNFLG